MTELVESNYKQLVTANPTLERVLDKYFVDLFDVDDIPDGLRIAAEKACDVMKNQPSFRDEKPVIRDLSTMHILYPCYLSMVGIRGVKIAKLGSNLQAVLPRFRALLLTVTTGMLEIDVSGLPVKDVENLWSKIDYEEGTVYEQVLEKLFACRLGFEFREYRWYYNRLRCYIVHPPALGMMDVISGGRVISSKVAIQVYDVADILGPHANAAVMHSLVSQERAILRVDTLRIDAADYRTLVCEMQKTGRPIRLFVVQIVSPLQNHMQEAFAAVKPWADVFVNHVVEADSRLINTLTIKDVGIKMKTGATAPLLDADTGLEIQPAQAPALASRKMRIGERGETRDPTTLPSIFLDSPSDYIPHIRLKDLNGKIKDMKQNILLSEARVYRDRQIWRVVEGEGADIGKDLVVYENKKEPNVMWYQKDEIIREIFIRSRFLTSLGEYQKYFEPVLEMRIYNNGARMAFVYNNMVPFKSRYRSMSDENKMTAALELSAAVYFLHQIGVVHGGITLENVVLDLQNSTVRLMDFSQAYVPLIKDKNITTSYSKFVTEGGRVRQLPRETFEWTTKKPVKRVAMHQAIEDVMTLLLDPSATFAEDIWALGLCIMELFIDKSLNIIWAVKKETTDVESEQSQSSVQSLTLPSSSFKSRKLATYLTMFGPIPDNIYEARYKHAVKMQHYLDEIYTYNYIVGDNPAEIQARRNKPLRIHKFVANWDQCELIRAMLSYDYLARPTALEVYRILQAYRSSNPSSYMLSQIKLDESARSRLQESAAAERPPLVVEPVIEPVIEPIVERVEQEEEAPLMNLLMQDYVPPPPPVQPQQEQQEQQIVEMGFDVMQQENEMLQYSQDILQPVANVVEYGSQGGGQPFWDKEDEEIVDFINNFLMD